MAVLNDVRNSGRIADAGSDGNLSVRSAEFEVGDVTGFHASTASLINTLESDALIVPAGSQFQFASIFSGIRGGGLTFQIDYRTRQTSGNNRGQFGSWARAVSGSFASNPAANQVTANVGIGSNLVALSIGALASDAQFRLQVVNASSGNAVAKGQKLKMSLYFVNL